MVTVRDIMQTEVATASPEMTVRELARLWDDYGISGAPVCDASGRVLGVVSATDLVRLTAEAPDDAVAPGPPYEELPPEEVEEDGEAATWYYFLAEEAPSRYDGAPAGIPEAAAGGVTVGDIMTPVIFSVRPQTTLPELARFLIRARIHRALVMEAGRLLGIVTAFDVLRAVAGEPNGREAARV